MLKQVASGTLQAFRGRGQRLLKALLAPGLLLVAIDALGPLAIPSVPILFSLSLIAFSWLAVSIHRAVLIPEHPATSFGWRVVVFSLAFVSLVFGSAFLVFLSLFLLKSIGLPLDYEIGKVVAILLGTTVLIWTSRYCLILPAIAIDKRYSLSASSFHTEGNRISVFLVFFALPLLLSVVGTTLGERFIDGLIGLIIGQSFLVLVTILEITMLSVLFRELVPDDA